MTRKHDSTPKGNQLKIVFLTLYTIKFYNSTVYTGCGRKTRTFLKKLVKGSRGPIENKKFFGQIRMFSLFEEVPKLWAFQRHLQYGCEAGSESSHSAVILGVAPLGSPWGLTGSLHRANSLRG